MKSLHTFITVVVLSIGSLLFADTPKVSTKKTKGSVKSSGQNTTPADNQNTSSPKPEEKKPEPAPTPNENQSAPAAGGGW